MKVILCSVLATATTLFALQASAQETTTGATVSPQGSPVTAKPGVPATTPAGRTTTTSAVLTEEGPAPSPTQDYPVTETASPINRPLLLTGVVLLGGTYAASAIDAASSARPEDHDNLYYPVVGPWMDLADRDCARTACGNGTNETLNRALLIADGIGQGLGAIGIVTSLFLPEKRTRHWLLIGDDKLTAGPTRVATGYGLGVAGFF